MPSSSLVIPAVKANISASCNDTSSDCLSAMEWVDGTEVDGSWFENFTITMNTNHYCLGFHINSKINPNTCLAIHSTICEFDCNKGMSKGIHKTNYTNTAKNYKLRKKNEG